MLFLCATNTGYGFASAEDTLPSAVKDLIKQKKVIEVEGEAERLSQSGNVFLANLAYGEASLLKGALEKAEIYFNKAMEMNPIGVEGKIGIAKVLAARKEVEKAKILLNEALRTSPQPVRLYYELGLILEASGDIKGATRAFQQGLAKYFSKQ